MSRWRAARIIAGNTALLWWAIQFATHAGITIHQALDAPSGYARLSEPARRNYTHMRPADVDELLKITESLRYRYDPSATFVHESVSSRFLNVDDNGIRQNHPGRNAGHLQEAIWLFGGSTTFGSGVTDEETVAAQLERLLGRAVINLGVRGNSALMENRLLGYYLRVGYRPTMALFLDGINETCQPDLFEDDVAALVVRAQEGHRWNFGVPVIYAASRIRRSINAFGRDEDDASARMSLMCSHDGGTNPLRVIHSRLLAERAATCALSGIECRTFVQPFPAVHGRHDDTTFVTSRDAAHLRDLFNHLAPSWRGGGATFVTDALDALDAHAFVDEIHYSRDANRAIAQSIASHLRRTDGPRR